MTDAREYHEQNLAFPVWEGKLTTDIYEFLCVRNLYTVFNGSDGQTLGIVKLHWHSVVM